MPQEHGGAEDTHRPWHLSLATSSPSGTFEVIRAPSLCRCGRFPLAPPKHHQNSLHARLVWDPGPHVVDRLGLQDLCVLISLDLVPGQCGLQSAALWLCQSHQDPWTTFGPGLCLLDVDHHRPFWREAISQEERDGAEPIAQLFAQLDVRVVLRLLIEEVRRSPRMDCSINKSKRRSPG